MSKAKPATRVICSRDGADDALGELGRAEAERSLLVTKLELALQRARDEFADGIQRREEKAAALRAALEEWAWQNPAEFMENKSLQLLNGVIGFRLSPPSVKPRNKMTWEKVMERLASFRDGIYLRVKASPDKERILKDAAEGKLNQKEEAMIGVSIVQQENCFIEPKQA